MFPVPNHLDVEDTFLFRLTMRQCLLLFIGAVLSYLLFLNLLSLIPDPTLAIFGSATVALFFFAGMLLVAFLRIGNRPLEEWGLVCLLYLNRPRISLWRFHTFDASERRACVEQVTRERQEQEEELWAR